MEKIAEAIRLHFKLDEPTAQPPNLNNFNF